MDFRAAAQKMHQTIESGEEICTGYPRQASTPPRRRPTSAPSWTKWGYPTGRDLGATAWPPFSRKTEETLFAIRADMDGLPIKEETGLPFASTNGCMHACGHDAHAAMGLAAAKILLEAKNELEGSVLFIFQPGEEGCPDGPEERKECSTTAPSAIPHRMPWRGFTQALSGRTLSRER